MRITSTAFSQGKPMPAKYTCDGDDVSPPIRFEDVPGGTKSLALILDDPDAPGGGFDHWALWNVPAERKDIPEGLATEKTVQNLGGALQGSNGFGRVGYGGPCPPSGTHTYVFRGFALDAMLDLPPGATTKELEAAMKGHVREESQLQLPYERKAR